MKTDRPFIKKIDFKTTVTQSAQLPSVSSEIVFMGRSNVGKSSILNALAKRKNLARKSQTPGKTQTINVFDVEYQMGSDGNYHCLFVDLPGVGYAKVSKDMKAYWAKHLNAFVSSRDSIRIFVYLVDARHYDLAIDKEILGYLEGLVKPDQMLLKVYTKSDKLNQSSLAKLKAHDSKALLVSNTKFKGLQDVHDAIFGFLFADRAKPLDV